MQDEAALATAVDTATEKAVEALVKEERVANQTVGQATSSLAINKSIIKNFRVDALKDRHIFSPEHLRDGIMKLGSSQKIIKNKFLKIIDQADKLGLLQESTNEIRTVIEGYKTTVRVRIERGVALKVNGFIGYSNRAIGNMFYF